MATSQIYDFGGFPDDFHDITAYLAEFKRQEAEQARAEELAVYTGQTVTITGGTYRVTGGRVRNRTKRGA